MYYLNNLVFFSDLFFVINELFFFFFTMLYIIYTNNIISRNANISVVSLSSGYGSLILLLLSYIFLNSFENTSIANYTLFNFMITKNALFKYFLMFLFFIFIIYFIYSWIEQSKYKILSIEYVYIYIAILYSLFFFIYAQDLLTIYLAIELITICSYILIVIQKYSVSLIELGIKYFIWNSIISVLFLYWMHSIYSTYATIDIRTLFLLINTSSTEGLLYDINSFFFLLVLFFFKIGLVPFHFWMLEIYEGILDNNTLFFLIFPKILFFIFFMKNIFIFVETVNVYWQFLGIFNVVITSIYMAVTLLKKNKLKSSIIYISLLSSGFLYLDMISLSIESILSVYFYLIVYCCHILLFFFIKQSIQIIGKKEHTFNIFLLNRLYTTQPIIAFTLLMVFFSLLGIPPFIGFFSKLYLLYGIFIQNNYYILFLVLISSLISAFFYLYIIKNLYINNIKQYLFLLPIQSVSSYLISICSCFILFFFINSNTLFVLLYKVLLSYYS